MPSPAAKEATISEESQSDEELVISISDQQPD
jgi:hypothetical protein